MQPKRVMMFLYFAAPYGIRESVERVGPKDKGPKNIENTVKQQSAAPHYPSKITYSLSNVYCDMINFAAQHLVLGGRLVYWLPVFRLVSLLSVLHYP